MRWIRAFAVPVLLLASCAPNETEPATGGDSPPPATAAAVGLIADSSSARSVLVRYWDHLSDAQYAEAAELYGGNWRDAGADWVEFDVADTMSTAGFLRQVCGPILVCSLQVEEVRRFEIEDPTRLRLTTALKLPSGQRFVCGTCCPEEGAPEDTFTFVLRKQGADFVVEELPLYVP